ncbi:MAG: hypothetical protein JJE48_06600 [Actinobacteria bacterium]|nr:hypothetical protein [Actinomycetota bacterium]
MSGKSSDELKAGKVVPTLDNPVDTLAPVEKDSGLVGIDEALSTLRVQMI